MYVGFLLSASVEVGFKTSELLEIKLRVDDLNFSSSDIMTMHKSQ